MIVDLLLVGLFQADFFASHAESAALVAKPRDKTTFLGLSQVDELHDIDIRHFD